MDFLIMSAGQLADSSTSETPSRDNFPENFDPRLVTVITVAHVGPHTLAIQV